MLDMLQTAKISVRENIGLYSKLSNDTKFIKIIVIVLKIQVLQSVNFFLFSLYFTHCFAHYLRLNLADKMYLLLYWVTYQQVQYISEIGEEREGTRSVCESNKYMPNRRGKKMMRNIYAMAYQHLTPYHIYKTSILHV